MEQEVIDQLAEYGTPGLIAVGALYLYLIRAEIAKILSPKVGPGSDELLTAIRANTAAIADQTAQFGANNALFVRVLDELRTVNATLTDIRVEAAKKG